MNETKKVLSIKDTGLYSAVYRKGKSYAGKYIVLYALPCKGDYPSRLGITVSKDRGCAVVRNRSKRIIRESYRHLHHLLKSKCNIVIVARQACTTATSTVIEDELRELLTAATLIDV